MFLRTIVKTRALAQAQELVDTRLAEEPNIPSKHSMNIGGQTYGHVLLRFTFGKEDKLDSRLFAGEKQAMGESSYIFRTCCPPVKFRFQDTDPDNRRPPTQEKDPCPFQRATQSASASWNGRGAQEGISERNIPISAHICSGSPRMATPRQRTDFVGATSFLS